MLDAIAIREVIIMDIAILGWGSLIWDPGELKYDGEWRNDGPCLPIEFARISKDKRLTLVIYENASLVQTLWCKSSFNNLDEAIENLKSREKTPKKEFIGYVSLVSNKSQSSVIKNLDSKIRLWARKKNIDAVIWTDLPSNFQSKENKKFNKDNVIEYLKALNEDDFNNAKKYILNAPKQINTPVRNAVFQEFRWELCNGV